MILTFNKYTFFQIQNVKCNLFNVIFFKDVFSFAIHRNINDVQFFITLIILCNILNVYICNQEGQK